MKVIKVSSNDKCHSAEEQYLRGDSEVCCERAQRLYGTMSRCGL